MMKYTYKIIAAIAVIIGLMAIITGLRVIGGFFIPDYQYYLLLVSYNVIMGAFSVFAGINIWIRNKHSIVYSGIITGSHLIVLFCLLTVFRDIISVHSIGAMIFRSVAWTIITIIIWKLFNKKISIV